MEKEEVVTYYIDAIEGWRKNMGLQKFMLIGHSFGGLIGTHYLEKYPERI